MAVVGFILGMLSLFTGPLCCFLIPIPGIVFSGIGLSQIKQKPDTQTGKGFAVAGMVLSIGSILIYFALIGLLFYLGFVDQILKQTGKF